jgi:hypothetical protein
MLQRTSQSRRRTYAHTDQVYDIKDHFGVRLDLAQTEERISELVSVLQDRAAMMGDNVQQMNARDTVLLKIASYEHETRP